MSGKRKREDDKTDPGPRKQRKTKGFVFILTLPESKTNSELFWGTGFDLAEECKKLLQDRKMPDGTYPWLDLAKEPTAHITKVEKYGFVSEDKDGHQMILDEYAKDWASIVGGVVIDRTIQNEDSEHIQRGAVTPSDRPHKCTWQGCQKAFKRKNELVIHTRSHTGERPFPCNECDYKGRTSGSLKEHKRRHSGDKPFKCKECDYKCTTSGNLLYHTRRHTGDKPFKCKECDYRCITASNLVYHKRRHTGDKPFECKECGYKFSQSSNLATHKRVVHHPDYVRAHASVSKVGCKFLDQFAGQLGIASIQHRHYQGKDLVGEEFKISGTGYKVDGHVNAEQAAQIKVVLPFDASDGFHVEFLGHPWHGYPNGKKANERSHTGFLYGDLYETTMDRIAYIKERTGLPFVCMWGDSWKECEKQVVNSILSYCEII
jgi:hypothetical protein